MKAIIFEGSYALIKTSRRFTSRKQWEDWFENHFPLKKVTRSACAQHGRFVKSEYSLSRFGLMTDLHRGYICLEHHY